MDIQFELDREKVLNWMQKYCHGYRNAKVRKDILPYLNLPDRYFRRIISVLKHENHIGSTSNKGYWFIPLITNDHEEIEACLQSALENKSRALDMLTDCDRQIKMWQDRMKVITQGQQEFFATSSVR